jgi:hypothetical protein
MESEIKNTSANQFSLFNSIAEWFFSDNSVLYIESELWERCVFVISGNTIPIYNFSQAEFSPFMAQLNKLVKAVHLWANYQKQQAMQQQGPIRSYIVFSWLLLICPPE